MSQASWIPISAQMHDHVMHLTGIPPRVFFSDAPAMVNAFADVADYYRMDTFRAIADSYNFEVEAMGARMVHSDTAMPTIDFREPLVKEPADLLKLKGPDPLKDGRLLFAMECFKLTAARSHTGIKGTFCAPLSMAVAMRSYPVLIKDMRKRPDFYRDLMTFITDQVILPYLKVQKDIYGVTWASGANAWAMIPNFSSEELRQFSVPWNLRVIERARDFGMTVSCSECSYIEERPERFDVQKLFAAFDIQVALAGGPRLGLGSGRWQELPLEPVRDFTAKYRAQGVPVSIFAAINARLMRDGPVSSIVEMARRFIDAFARDHDLTISIANIPADTASENVHAAVTAVHTYGSQPIAPYLGEVKLELPHRESFAEWKAAH